MAAHIKGAAWYLGGLYESQNFRRQPVRLRFSGILCMADKQAITLADGQPRCHTEIPQAPRTQTRLLAKRNTPKNGRQINQLQAPSFFSRFPCLSEHIALLDPIGRASDAWPTFTRAAAPRIAWWNHPTLGYPRSDSQAARSVSWLASCLWTEVSAGGINTRAAASCHAP